MPVGLRTFQLAWEHTKIGKPAQDGHLYKTDSFLCTKGVRFIEVWMYNTVQGGKLCMHNCKNWNGFCKFIWLFKNCTWLLLLLQLVAAPTRAKVSLFSQKEWSVSLFAIKVAVAESGIVVFYLPMANSHVTKYIVDRGARVYAILTSTNYCVSPLVQGDLQIPCRFEIHMSATVKK